MHLKTSAAGDVAVSRCKKVCNLEVGRILGGCGRDCRDRVCKNCHPASYHPLYSPRPCGAGGVRYFNTILDFTQILLPRLIYKHIQNMLKLPLIYFLTTFLQTAFQLSNFCWEQGKLTKHICKNSRSNLSWPLIYLVGKLLPLCWLFKSNTRADAPGQELKLICANAFHLRF